MLKSDCFCLQTSLNNLYKPNRSNKQYGLFKNISQRSDPVFV